MIASARPAGHRRLGAVDRPGCSRPQAQAPSERQRARARPRPAPAARAAALRCLRRRGASHPCVPVVSLRLGTLTPRAVPWCLGRPSREGLKKSATPALRVDPVARRFPPRRLGAGRRQLRRELVLPDPARRAARPDDHRRPAAGLVLRRWSPPSPRCSAASSATPSAISPSTPSASRCCASTASPSSIYALQAPLRRSGAPGSSSSRGRRPSPTSWSPSRAAPSTSTS